MKSILFNKKTWLIIASLVLLAGCAPRYLDKSPLSIIRYDYMPVDQKALANYKAIVAINPNDQQAPKAFFWIGQDAYNQRKWQQAGKKFTDIIQRFPDSDWAAVSGIMLARVKVQQKENLAAIAWLYKMLEQFKVPAIQTAVNDVADRIINDECSISELARVRASYPGTSWAEQAMFVGGKRYLDLGQPDIAIKQFENFLVTYPLSQYLQMTKELISKATRIIPINRNRIGCLLPLSGPYAPYGLAIKQGLELATDELNISKSEDEKLSLVVVDTKGTTHGAVAGLQRLRDIEKVMVIVGPALSDEVKALIPELNKQPIPVITTSAAEIGLPEKHPYLFRYMHTNEHQGEAMAEYIILRKNLQRIGIVNGEASYDRSLADALEKKTLALGGEIVAKLEYKKGTTDFKQQMLALGGVDPGKIKDRDVKDRKEMEKIIANAAVTFFEKIHPNIIYNKKEENDSKEVISVKKVAIIRFKENGELVTKFNFGKMFTEKFSYTLAPLNGISVATQADTIKGVRAIGLSPYSVEQYHGKKIGEQLRVDYLILGKLSQTGETMVIIPGEPLPVKIDIEFSLIECQTNKEIAKFKEQWRKSISPEKNIKDMEALYLPVPASDAILIASQLEFYELVVPVFGADAWLTPNLLRQGREELDNAIFSSTYWADDPTPRNQEFVKKYETKYSSSPMVLAAQGYDALWLIAAILNQISDQQVKRSSFQKELLNIKAFNGITGRAMMTPDGDIKRQPLFLNINKGKIRRVR